MNDILVPANDDVTCDLKIMKAMAQGCDENDPDCNDEANEEHYCEWVYQCWTELDIECSEWDADGTCIKHTVTAVEVCGNVLEDCD